MESIRFLYNVGRGPSSSHTMGPEKACLSYLKKYPQAKSFVVNLYGSLSLSGKGHFTDVVIRKTLGENTKIIFEDDELAKSPNGMMISGYDINNKLVDTWTIYSVGGSKIVIDGYDKKTEVNIYPHKNLKEISNYIEKEKINFYQYVLAVEGKEIIHFLESIIDEMFSSVEEGLNNRGLIPGKLKLERVAKNINTQANMTSDELVKQKLLITSYSYAVSEQNASGKRVVTAPTCGASGVVPSLLYYLYKDKKTSKEKLVEGLAVAGIFGNIIKHNGSISGAVAGCQAEIGSATAMAAAMLSYVEGLSNRQIEYASEVAFEHQLGMTCDPVMGYVQIPCIERNAVGALRALDAMLFAKYIGNIRNNHISFDDVVATMIQTGMDLKREYRETALGGLATFYKQKKGSN